MSNFATQFISEKEKLLMPELLARLARQSIAPARLGSVKGSEIYQVSAGWQREVLVQDPNVITATTALSFEEAVQSPDVHSIFVPRHAALTQETVTRILERNVLTQTIFWEV